MKVLGLCGSHKKKSGTSEFVMKQALEGCKSKDAEVEYIRFSDYTIYPCAACQLCFQQEPCPLFNNPKDGLKEILGKIDEADAIVFCSPVYAYGQPAQVINFFHRCKICHEKERSPHWGTHITDLDSNPFSGKAVANIAVCIAAGHEGALNDIWRYANALTYTSCISLGLSMLEYDTDTHTFDIEEAEFAKKMAFEAGARLVDFWDSPLFQTMKYLYKY